MTWENGFASYNGSTYYLDPTSHYALTGLQTVNGSLYWFGGDGAMAHDTTVTTGGRTYTAASDGKLTEQVQTQAVYRLYCPASCEHLFTTDANEVRVQVASGTWEYEGIAWYAPTTGTPVWRLFKGSHHYTADAYERSVITSTMGWVYDFSGNPTFMSGGSVTIFRLFNQQTGQHLLSTGQNEYNVLPGMGWGWVQEPAETMACVAGGDMNAPMP